MAYSTRADLARRVGGEDRLIQLADLDGDGLEDAGVVEAAIAEADSLIDSYAKKRHAVPIANASPDLLGKSARMAVRALRNWKGMPLSTDADDERVDLAWLRDVADGRVAVAVSPTPEASSMVIDKAEPRESTKSVSRDKLKGFW